MTKRSIYGLGGLVLGLGAPVGSFLLRVLFAHVSPVEEISSHGFFYLYMLAGTCFFFALFGIMLGGKEDKALSRIEDQEKTLQRISSQMDTLTRDLQLRCSDCEIVRDMEAQVLQAEKLATVGRFAASVAHEVNNPLMGIKNAMAFLAREEIAEEKRDEYRELVKEGLSRIEETVRSLLQFAKQHELEKKPIHLEEAIAKALALSEPQLKRRQVVVDKVLEKDLMVLGDGRYLQQVFLNLFINAYDAMERKGGILGVKGYKKDGVIVCEVSDTGKGIPREKIPLIFDPFYTTKTKGTGLGLPVTKSIIEKHGGELTVKSNEKVGTTFLIRLPEWRKS